MDKYTWQKYALNECINYEGYMREQEFNYQTLLTGEYNPRNYLYL